MNFCRQSINKGSILVWGNAPVCEVAVLQLGFNIGGYKVKE